MYTFIISKKIYGHISLQNVFSVLGLFALGNLPRSDLHSNHSFRVLTELEDFAGWSPFREESILFYASLTRQIR